MTMKVITLTAAALILTGGSALAHPGSKLLTAGGSDEKAVTVGVSFEDTNGVHLFRGPKSIASETIAGGGAPRVGANIKITKRTYVWRSFRKLRTQGFYAGDPHPSRRYVQGFYAGQTRGH